eukprot:1161835-Pelagomonas_calceolata.AAC.17
MSIPYPSLGSACSQVGAVSSALKHVGAVQSALTQSINRHILHPHHPGRLPTMSAVQWSPI